MDRVRLEGPPMTDAKKNTNKPVAIWTKSLVKNENKQTNKQLVNSDSQKRQNYQICQPVVSNFDRLAVFHDSQPIIYHLARYGAKTELKT